jgi:hypothetical protein
MDGVHRGVVGLPRRPRTLAASAVSLTTVLVRQVVRASLVTAILRDGFIRRGLLLPESNAD